MAQKREGNKKRTILIIAGSRGEYGYFRPIIREIEKRKDLDYEIVACNMHLLPAFGSTIDEIQKDGFKIGGVIHNTLDGYTRLTMAKSLGIFLMELPGQIERMKPDIILTAGDRGEQLVAAIAGSHLYIPVAHVQAGEVSGNIDGVTRHAITRFAHIHFASNTDAAERLKKMGEEEFRIFNVGAPQLDELFSGVITPEEEIRKKYQIGSGRSLLVVQHSVTEEFEQAEHQMEETMKAIANTNYPAIVILNNSDAGSHALRSVIHRKRTDRIKIFENVPRPDFAGLMKTVSVLVGNSSSGIIEAPLFKLPVINIGNRQWGRMQSTNVINAPHNASLIKDKIEEAVSAKFRKQAQKARSVYGDGKSAKRIVDVLENIKIDDKLLIKRLTY